MKKALLSILGLITLALVVNSCVKDTDYETPQIGCSNPELTGEEVAISSILNQWDALNPSGTGETPVEFGETDTYIKGFVISTDQTGNFYKEVYIQNSQENPTASVKVAVNMSNTYLTYNFGHIIYVSLNGLSLNKNNGEMVLGKLIDGQVDEMSENTAKANIKRSCEIYDMTPVSVTTPDDINDSHIGKYVTLNNVQFAENFVGKTFVDPADSYDSYAQLMSCADGSVIPLETSTFASFKDAMLPIGKGSISGIITRNYYDDFYVLKINHVSDVQFNDPRCDGVTLTPTMTLDEFMDTYSGEIYPTDDIVEAYVVSSDATGNFYKNIFIQDKPENPTVGLQILVDDYDLFQMYPVGSKVYLKPSGLYIGESYNVPSIGYFDGSYPDRITSGEIGQYLVNSGETATIVPTLVSFDGGNPVIDATGEEVPLGILVALENMQLDLSELGAAYTYYNGTTSVNRQLFNCESEVSIILRNSGYATFANETFPQGQGTITAIMSGYLGTSQLVIRDTSDINFTFERCDPEMLDCMDGTTDGANIIFSDDFESYSTYATSLPGWVNESTSGGSELFEVRSYSGNKYMQCSAYGTGEDPMEVWLITPAINLDTTENEFLDFSTKTGYNNGAALTVFVSTDFTGDINAATWLMVDGTIANGPSSGYESSFTNSGHVDVSCLEGDMYVAFRYKGGASGITTTFQIDDVTVTAD